MSNVSLSSRPRHVKSHRVRFDKYRDPDPKMIPDLWRELLARESLAPDGLRAGLARARTKLLQGIPAWRLPEALDRLAAGGSL